MPDKEKDKDPKGTQDPKCAYGNSTLGTFLQMIVKLKMVVQWRLFIPSEFRTWRCARRSRRSVQN